MINEAINILNSAGKLIPGPRGERGRMDHLVQNIKLIED